MAAVRVLLQNKNKGNKVEQIELNEKTQTRPQRKFNLVPGVGVISYLPLQMSLYFNVYFSPIWMLALIVGLVAKFGKLQTLYKYVTIIVYVLMTIIEALRLFLGYEGNLREKVPELASFWLLSLFQLPLIIYLMANVNTIILPLEWAINIPMIVLLLTEIVTGFRALQLMGKAQGVKFQVSQLHPHLRQDSNRQSEKEDKRQ